MPIGAYNLPRTKARPLSVDFNGYDLDPAVFDEAFLPDGTPRGHYRALHDAMREATPERFTAIGERINRYFENESISFTLHGGDEAVERIIPIDCVPRILPAAEWLELEAGLSQRLTALNHFLNDVYGAGRIVADGVIPADLVRGCPHYRVAMRGVEVPGGIHAAICGTDVVRTSDGYRVLEDNLRTPSGVSYMVANRKAVKAGLRRLYRRCRVRDVEHYGRLLLMTLKELAPRGKPDPTIVVLTPGVYNAAFYEHMFLANEIGAALVEGRDLLVHDGFVYMRSTAGLRPVDVIYRRIDDDFLDPLAFRPDSLLGVPGLMHAYKLGNIAIVNAPGSGVGDDKGVYAFVPDMIRYYLAEEPLIANVETRLCRRPQDLEYTLDNLANLVVKRVGESGGYGMLIGPHATAKEREDYAKAVRADPADFVAQPVLALSRSPCFIDGEPAARHVDLRPFVLQGGQTRMVPGAFCRVALRKGSLVVNSSQGGGGKDVWVLADDAASDQA